MEFPQHIRDHARETAVTTLAALTLLAASGCTAESANSDQPAADYEVSAYLPSYTDDASLRRLADSPDITGPLDQVTIAFAIPQADGSVRPPDLSQAYVDSLNRLPADTRLAMSVGGYSTDNGRAEMESNLRGALARPAELVAGMLAARQQLAERIGRDPQTIGFSLDLEWPQANERDAMTQVATKLDEQAPAAIIDMAIPASGNQEGYDLAVLAGSVDTFDVMTYDYTTNDNPEDGVSGDLAPQDQVRSDIERVIEQIGDASQVRVGFPAYANRFVGATAPGQSYRIADDGSPSQVKLNQVPADTVDAAGHAIVDGAFTSLVTPAMVTKTMTQLKNDHPTIGGSFAWELSGMTPAFAAALKNGQ